MPIIEGRDPQALREFIDTITRAAHDLLDAPTASVRAIATRYRRPVLRRR